MFNIFKTKSFIDAPTAENIYQIFVWAMENFDRSFFTEKTVLVLPCREYFPDRASSENAMAQVLCTRILTYCGLNHWPFKLVPPNRYQPQTPPLLQLSDFSRGLTSLCHHQQLDVSDLSPPQLEISYSSAMMKKPMDLVASMSKFIAQHYVMQSQLTPPAGINSFNATSEVIAVFMGFGIMIANSAYTFRGSCARCYDPRANREAALSEDEAIYCLALFAHIKNIDNKAIIPSLKPHLRTALKKARKQCTLQLANRDI